MHAMVANRVSGVPGKVIAHAALFAALAVVATAQTRVTLQSRSKPSELEVQVLKLGQDSSRPAAMAALIATGRPAVQVLVKAVQNDDALSLPALRVLAGLGGTARSAAPALARLAKNPTPLGAAAARALAAIGERDSVVFADWQGNRIVELDASGQQLREVAVKGPWCVQPVANDHLLVCCYTDKVVREIDWQGKEIARLPVPGSPIWAERLLDGTLLVSEAEKKRILHVATDGTVLAEVAAQARSFVRLPNDHLVVLDFESSKLREWTMTGQAVHEVALSGQAMAFAVLGNGHMRVVYQNKLTEVDAAGQEVDLGVAGAYVAYALACQRDGTQFFGENGKLTHRDAAGDVLWKFDCQSASCVVPRIDLPDSK